MKQRIVRLAAGIAVAVGLSTAFAQPGPSPSPSPSPSRGELLYATHCTACHTQQVHWRDQRAATDWPSLTFQVRRWQGVLSLGWGEGDVTEVASYLNQIIYRFGRPAEPAASINAAAAPAPVPSVGRQTTAPPSHLASPANALSPSTSSTPRL